MSAVMWAITMVIIGFDQGRILLAAPHYTTMFWLFLLPMFDPLIRGLVHTIPYGGISQLTNYSRDWVIMKLRFTVPFDTDPNKVKKIGFDMLEDPIHKEGFLEPFKSQGVFEFDDVGMVIRGKFMAKPGAQWTIRKEVCNRVKAELEAAGIPFVRREVRVAIPGLERAEDLSDTDKAKVVATAAAAEAVRQQQAEAEVAAQKPK